MVGWEVFAITLKRKGYEVVVLEAASKLSWVGAGIQKPPNGTRIVEAYGLKDKLKEQVAWPRNIALRGYTNNQQLGLMPVASASQQEIWLSVSNCPFADYRRILFDAAVALGAEVKLSARVASVDQGKPSVITTEGKEFESEVFVVTDGIRSEVRECIFASLCIKPTSTAKCVFRGTVSVEEMMADPQTAELMTDDDKNARVGPDRHVMAYSIRQGAITTM